MAFDALGMVVGTAVAGKNSEGDSLHRFKADLSSREIADHLENPLANPQDVLKGATTRVIYDLHRFKNDSKLENEALHAFEEWIKAGGTASSLADWK